MLVDVDVSLDMPDVLDISYLCCLVLVDVSLDMPDVLDISYLRGAGKQPDEEELADDASPAAQGARLILNFFGCAILMLCKGCLYVVMMCHGHCHSSVGF